MLSQLAKNRFNRVPDRAPPLSRADSLETNLKKAEEANKLDTFEGEKETNEYGDNQFWKLDDQYDLDDLLAEME